MPFTCVSEFGRLDEARQHRRELESAYQERSHQLDRAMDAFESAVIERTAFLLSGSSEELSTSEPSKIEVRVQHARSEVEKSEEQCVLIQDQLDRSRAEEDALTDLPIRMAESAITKMGLVLATEPPVGTKEAKADAVISPNVTDREREKSKEPQRAYPQRDYAPRAAEGSRDEKHRGKGEALRAPAQGYGDHVLGPWNAGVRKSRDVWAPSRYGYARSVQPYRRDIRDVKRDQVMKVRRVLSDISRQRRNLRKNYHRDLDALLQAQSERQRATPKIEFDQNHFVEQGRFTQQQITAEAEQELYTRQAKELHAFYAEEVTSDFGDWPSDGYDDSGFEPLCPIWKLEEARITRWVDSERERLGLNNGRLVPLQDSDWDVTEPHMEPDGATVLPFRDGIEPNFEELCVGKWRQKIDEYQHKQAKLRALPKLGTLFWWQEMPGV